jgi:hypothetical protein
MLSSTLPDFSMPATARGQASSVRSHVQTRRNMRAPQMSGGSLARSMSLIRSIVTRGMRTPMRSVILMCISASCTAILVNALWLQKARHPMSQRPTEIITQNAIPLPPVRPVTVAANPVLARDELARLSAPVTVGRSPAAAREIFPARETTPATAAASTPKIDPIGDLLRSQESRVPDARTQDTKSPEARPVASAQRALVKLGYSISRTDGRFGDETRIAIERFERDRKLPVTRDLSPRTLRELAAVSGTRFE